MNYLSEDKFGKVYLYTFAKTVFPSLIILTEKMMIFKISPFFQNINLILMRMTFFSEETFVRDNDVFFWIESSAKRAFGGCLGNKRR